MAKKIKFEEAFKELEEIAEALEAGELPLDEAIAKYEKGIKALKECYEILGEAEKRIEILSKELDGAMKAAPFDVKDDSEPEK
jgi:exodeoxyribonuclease VII small subunit